MKIAFCFYGQSRSFRFCSFLNRKVFNQLREQGFELDFFIHTWDSNCGGEGEDSYYQQDCTVLREDLQIEYSPKSLEIESLEKVLQRYPGFRELIKTRTVGFIYSHSRVLQQMVEYVRLTGIQYDHVITLRLDEWFVGGFRVSDLPEPIKDFTVRTITGATIPENRWDYHDTRDIASLRDEGFWMNRRTAETVSRLFQWIYSSYRRYHLLTNPDLERQVEVPEVLFSLFFTEMGIEQEPKGFAQDRIIVREPVDLILDPKNHEHLQVLYEIREWVDWYIKDPKIFQQFAESRIAGKTLKQSLLELKSTTGVNFLENWGKQKRFG